MDASALVAMALDVLGSDEFIRAYYAISVLGVLFVSVTLAEGIYGNLSRLTLEDFSAPDTGNKTQKCEKVGEQLATAMAFKRDKRSEATANVLAILMLGVVVPTVALVLTVVCFPWLAGAPALVVTVGDNAGDAVLSPSAQSILGLSVRAILTEDGVQFLRNFLGLQNAFEVGFDARNFWVFLFLIAQKVWAVAFLKDLVVIVLPKIWAFSTAQSKREQKLRDKWNELECQTG